MPAGVDSGIQLGLAALVVALVVFMVKQLWPVLAQRKNGDAGSQSVEYWAMKFREISNVSVRETVLPVVEMHMQSLERYAERQTELSEQTLASNQRIERALERMVMLLEAERKR